MLKRQDYHCSIDYDPGSAPGMYHSYSSVQTTVPFEANYFTLGSIARLREQGETHGSIFVTLSALGGDTEEDALRLVREARPDVHCLVRQAHPDGFHVPIELASNRTGITLRSAMDSQRPRPRMVVTGGSVTRRSPNIAADSGGVPMSLVLPLRRAYAARPSLFAPPSEDTPVELGFSSLYGASPRSQEPLREDIRRAIVEQIRQESERSGAPARENAFRTLAALNAAYDHGNPSPNPVGVRVQRFDASLFSLGHHGDEEDIQAAIDASLRDQDASEDSPARPGGTQETPKKRKKRAKQQRTVGAIHKLNPMPKNPDDPKLEAKSDEPRCSICCTRKTTHMAFPCMHALACDVCVYELAERFDRADPASSAGKATRSCCICRQPVKYYIITQDVVLKPIYS